MGFQNDEGLESVAQKMKEDIKGIRNDTVKIKDVSASIAGKTEALVGTLDAIRENTDNIQKSTQNIKSIANRTNMLSLNASIESARAGEAGRGFSVVAQQMQSLANNSKEASEYVFTVINSLYENVSKINDDLKKLFAEIEEQKECSESMFEKIEKLEKLSVELSL